MAKNSVNLDKIKRGIEDIKKDNTRVQGTIAESNGLIPKTSFLHDLERSLRTGVETPATAAIKMVENATAMKNNENIIHGNVKQQTQQTQSRQIPNNLSNIVPNDNDDFNPREEQYFNSLQEKKLQNAGLGKILEEYSGGVPPQQNQGYQQPHKQVGNLNEDMINQIVSQKSTEFLSEHLGGIFEEALKDTFLEMYAIDRIKKVISENKDLIKPLIREVIREIQESRKTK